MQRAWGHCRSPSRARRTFRMEGSVSCQSSRKLAMSNGNSLTKALYMVGTSNWGSWNGHGHESFLSCPMHVLKKARCVFIGCRCDCHHPPIARPRHTFFMLKPSPGRFFLLFLSEAKAQGAQVRIVDQVHSSPQGTNKTWMECYVCVCYMLYSQFRCYCYYIVVIGTIRTVMVAVVIFGSIVLTLYSSIYSY